MWNQVQISKIQAYSILHAMLIQGVRNWEVTITLEMRTCRSFRMAEKEEELNYGANEWVKVNIYCISRCRKDEL